jgi:hypothetical protein
VVADSHKDAFAVAGLLVEDAAAGAGLSRATGLLVAEALGLGWLPGCEPFGELLQVGGADSGQAGWESCFVELGSRGAAVGVQERAEGLGGGEADGGRAAGVAVVLEGFTGLVDGVTDAGGGDLQQVGEHGHGAHLPLVAQRDQQASGIVQEWLVGEGSGCPSGSARHAVGGGAGGPGGLGRGQGGDQPFQFRAGHAGQPQVGQLPEHGLAALGGTAQLTNVTDVRCLGAPGGELGAEGVVPGAVHRVALDRQGIQALRADRDAGRALTGVQGGLDTQTAAGAGRRDGLDDDEAVAQTPVTGYSRRLAGRLTRLGWLVGRGECHALRRRCTYFGVAVGLSNILDGP